MTSAARAPSLLSRFLTKSTGPKMAHALADRLERNQRPQSDQAMAAKLIRGCLTAAPPATSSRHRALIFVLPVAWRLHAATGRTSAAR